MCDDVNPASVRSKSTSCLHICMVAFTSVHDVWQSRTRDKNSHDEVRSRWSILTSVSVRVRKKATAALRCLKRFRLCPMGRVNRAPLFSSHWKGSRHIWTGCMWDRFKSKQSGSTAQVPGGAGPEPHQRGFYTALCAGSPDLNRVSIHSLSYSIVRNLHFLVF